MCFFRSHRLAFSYHGVTLLSHNVAYSNFARMTAGQRAAQSASGAAANGPTKAQLLASTVFYNYTEVRCRRLGIKSPRIVPAPAGLYILDPGP